MKKHHLLFISILLISFIACNKDEDNNNSSAQAFIYPAETGNYWNYSRVMRYTNFDTIINLPDSLYIETHVEVSGEYLLYDSLDTYEFIETEIIPNKDVSMSNTYFSNMEDGFYYHAYLGTGSSLPVKSQGKIKFKNLEFDNLNSLFDYFSVPHKTLQNTGIKTGNYFPPDSLFVEDPPVKSIIYPLIVGVEWIYRDESVLGGINRKAISNGTIMTPAGSFNCFKIKTIYLNPAYNKIEWYDYISTKGLVKRHITIRDISFTDAQGNIIATGDAVEEIKLINYFVK